MMMPKFIDVIEFVKDGQSDPEMEETLRLHPDGQELLKQARFICKMLATRPMPRRPLVTKWRVLIWMLTDSPGLRQWVRKSHHVSPSKALDHLNQ